MTYRSEGIDSYELYLYVHAAYDAATLPPSLAALTTTAGTSPSWLESISGHVDDWPVSLLTEEEYDGFGFYDEDEEDGVIAKKKFLNLPKRQQKAFDKRLQAFLPTLQESFMAKDVLERELLKARKEIEGTMEYWKDYGRNHRYSREDKRTRSKEIQEAYKYQGVLVEKYHSIRMEIQDKVSREFSDFIGVGSAKAAGAHVGNVVITGQK